MKKVIILFAVICSLLASLSWAAAIQDVDLSGLTDEQRAQLVMQAEQMKKNSTVLDSKNLVEKANEYTQLADNISTVVVRVAGQVGIAADEFLKSTSGKITVGMIFWKVAGKDLLEKGIHLLVGFGLFAIMMPLWIYFFRRICMIESVEELTPEQGLKKKKIIHYYSQTTGDVDTARWVMLILLIGGIGLDLWIILS